jgi:hypothetical protein
MTTKASSPAAVFLACGLSSAVINGIARETGFTKRAGGKIRADDFLAQLCSESIKGTVSLNDIAAAIHAHTGVSASRQAYWERLNEEGVLFFQTILAELIHSKLPTTAWTLCPLYKRILIQDSTIIQLPTKLFEHFSGVRNSTCAVCNARIQGIYDLCSGRFIQFAIDSYSKNDLSVAPQIPIEPGDLVLRDRGYFLLSTIAAHKAQGVDTITRYKHKTALYDPHTKAPLDLLPLLTQRQTVDLLVLAGEKKDVRLRLLAVPVPEEVANVRRMKAKREVRKRNPSAEILALMGWSIFLVTIENTALTIKVIMELYGLRWRIENIFKTWKSHLSFDKVHQVSELQLRILLTARFIMISICYHQAYLPLCQAIFAYSNKQLSLMKFIRYVRKNLGLLPRLLALESSTVRAVARYCSYDNRKRSNFVDNVRTLFADLSSIFPALA